MHKSGARKIRTVLEAPRCQNGKVMEYPTMRFVHRECNKPKREKHVTGSKDRTAETSKPFDLVYQAKGFEVCPADFLVCFVPIFSLYVPFLPFLKGNVYSVTLYVGTI